MTRYFVILAAIAGLTACQPAVPDSAGHLANGSVNPGRGVGFDNNLSEARARQAEEARLEAEALAAARTGQTGPSAALAQGRPISQSAQVPRPAPQTATAAQLQQRTPAPATGYTDPELAQIAARNDAAAAAANSGQSVVNASPSNAPPPLVDNPGGISNETDFEAVSARRSIESDAQRQAQLRSQYQVVAPTALPSRTSSGPNVVEYALQTNHAVGTRVHRRVSVASASRTQARCAEYASANDAQAAFLSRGGPQRDRLGLDPDGDGYACGWDPTPFRRAAGN